MQKLQNIKKVAVVGGGPAGVAMARYLIAEGAFPTIHVYEQRSTCGGVWNYTKENDSEAQFAVPQTQPYQRQERPVWRNGNETNPRLDPLKEHATFISPLYERLEANLPKPLMQHKDLAFPEEEQLFPTHAAITEYLERYADDVRHIIRFETQVTHVSALDPCAKTGWSITTLDLASNKTQEHNYDALAIATGHYTVPFIPSIPGLHEWHEQHPGTISHSKFFRRPEDFAGLRTLTIGVGASGLDIASQITQTCAPPLLVSSRANPTPPSPTPHTRLNVGPIASVDPSTRTVHFSDPDHPSAHAIDRILFCTGYLYSYPGFAHAHPPFSTAPLLPAGPAAGARTHNVYEHIFYTAAPTLAFLTLPQRIVPFPIAEAQAAVVAGVWSGRVGLPSRGEMEAWEAERAKERGNGKTFHYMLPGEDVEYMERLRGWARSGGGEGKASGKEPPCWGPRELWMRERVFEMKERFAGLGEGRRDVRTVEELGFEFPGEEAGVLDRAQNGYGVENAVSDGGEGEWLVVGSDGEVDGHVV